MAGHAWKKAMHESAANRPRFRRILIAAVLVALATGIRFVFQPVFGTIFPFIIYYPTVVAAAWYGGFLSGATATVLSTVAANFFFMGTSFGFSHMSAAMLVATIVFGVSCLFITFLAELRVRGATIQAQLKEQLQHQNRFIEAILSSIQDAFCVIDREWRFVYANEPLTRLAGLSRDQVIGKGIWEIFPVRADVKTQLEKAMNEGVAAVYETRNEHTGRSLSVHAYPSEEGITVYAVDISERKRIEEALAQAKTELEKHATTLEQEVQLRTKQLRETVAQLEAFSYTVSHDLRSPLRAMQGFAHLTLEEYGTQLDESGRNYLQQIDAAARRMDALIQDVIAFNKVARAELRIESINTEKLVDEVIHQYPSIHKPHASFEITRPLQPVLASPAALTQAVSNLLGNAVKFVGAGEKALVKIWTEKEDSTVRLFVQDNGIGIPNESMGKVFEPFHRAHPDRGYEGTGIGLAIVKKAVERMGGKLGAESHVGKGSKFWIELPAGT